MIQRIQSVYLLLVCVLMAVTAFSPLFLLTDNSGVLLTWQSQGLIAKEMMVIFPTLGVLCLVGLSALLPFINIFLYKKRKLQMKVGTLTSLLILFFYVSVFVYYTIYKGDNSIAFSGIQYGIVLPIVALIFNVLAILKIKKDEKLVRSLDRIR